MAKHKREVKCILDLRFVKVIFPMWNHPCS